MRPFSSELMVRKTGERNSVNKKTRKEKERPIKTNGVFQRILSNGARYEERPLEFGSIYCGMVCMFFNEQYILHRNTRQSNQKRFETDLPD